MGLTFIGVSFVATLPSHTLVVYLSTASAQLHSILVTMTPMVCVVCGLL